MKVIKKSVSWKINQKETTINIYTKLNFLRTSKTIHIFKNIQLIKHLHTFYQKDYQSERFFFYCFISKTFLFSTLFIHISLSFKNIFIYCFFSSTYPHNDIPMRVQKYHYSLFTFIFILFRWYFYHFKWNNVDSHVSVDVLIAYHLDLFF